MAFFQGSPLPSITETTTETERLPTDYTKYLSDITKAGSVAMGRTGAESVAPYDPYQTAAYEQLPGAAGAYRPGLAAAAQTANKAAAGVTPERIQALMNPYTSSVVDEMARLSQQNVQRNILPAMKAGFVGTGGLGSQRYAGALGQSLADIQANLTGQQAGVLSKGYSDALKGALDEAQLMSTAARTQSDIAQREQTLGLGGAEALSKAGAERQAYQQAILDAPLKTATASAGLARGLPVPKESIRKFVGPKAGMYQISDIDKVAGVLSLLAGAQDKSGGLKTPGIIDFIKRNLGGESGSSTTAPYYGVVNNPLDPNYKGPTGTGGYGGDFDKMLEEIYGPRPVYEPEIPMPENTYQPLSNEELNQLLQEWAASQ